jgi:hypothetical protein
MDMVAILHGLRKIVNKINAIDFSGGTVGRICWEWLNCLNL